MSQDGVVKPEEKPVEKPAEGAPNTDDKPVEKPAADAKPEGDKPADGQPPTDVKPAETPKPDAAVKPGEANADAQKPEGAPDAYQLTAPDGMDAEELKTFETFARERKLTNEQAQAALNTLPDALASQVSRFRADAEKHPEIGGEKFEKATADAVKALDHFLPATEPEGAALRRGLNVSGYGNYAPLVLLLSRIGKAMGEDGGVGIVKASTTVAAEDKPAEQAKKLFPSSPN